MALRVPNRVKGQSVLIDVSNDTSLVKAMSKTTPANAAPGKKLSPAAKRALEEAETRRKTEADSSKRPAESGGPEGAEPTRFGDWERGGIAYDF